jgi:hypothetical protein
MDGAFFGTSFAHIFQLNYPHSLPKTKGPFSQKIYGFKIHESAINHPPKLKYDFTTNSYLLYERPKVKFAKAEYSKWNTKWTKPIKDESSDTKEESKKGIKERDRERDREEQKRERHLKK